MFEFTLLIAFTKMINELAGISWAIFYFLVFGIITSIIKLKKIGEFFQIW